MDFKIKKKLRFVNKITKIFENCWLLSVDLLDRGKKKSPGRFICGLGMTLSLLPGG